MEKIIKVEWLIYSVRASAYQYDTGLGHVGVAFTTRPGRLPDWLTRKPFANRLATIEYGQICRHRDSP